MVGCGKEEKRGGNLRREGKPTAQAGLMAGSVLIGADRC